MGDRGWGSVVGWMLTRVLPWQKVIHVACAFSDSIYEFWLALKTHLYGFLLQIFARAQGLYCVRALLHIFAITTVCYCHVSQLR